MTEYDGLVPDDNALRLFFGRDTLYLYPEHREEKTPDRLNENASKQEIKNKALVLEGNSDAPLLVVFSHPEPAIFAAEWSEMMRSLLFNERAMNLKADQVALINIQQNPEKSMESILAILPAKKVLVWGNIPHEKRNRFTPLSNHVIEGKEWHQFESPSSYLSKENKALLWAYIKTNLLK